MILLDETLKYQLKINLTNNSLYNGVGYDYDLLFVSALYYLKDPAGEKNINNPTGSRSRVENLPYGTARDINYALYPFDITTYPGNPQANSIWSRVPRGNTYPIELRVKIEYFNPGNKRDEFVIIPDVAEIELVQFLPGDFVPGFDVNV